MKNAKVPNWFIGEVYEKGAVVKNPYSGRTCELNNIELSIYDYVIGLSNIIQSLGGVLEPKTGSFQKEMAKGISWFRNNNAEAYMILLD
jgi:hypothetical protein